MPDWPPPHSIRRHPRARYARLRISAERGLEVLLPDGLPDSLARRLIEQRRDWVIRQLERLPSVPVEPSLPTTIELPAVGESVSISYGDGGSRWRQQAGQLSIPERDPKGCLRDWLKQRAKDALPARLQVLAELNGYRFERTRIGLQRSRWGSYSSRGTVSLNAALLLLQPRLTDHVLLHELCHSEHMHHGPAFYRRLAETDPDHRAHAQALRLAWQQLPGWLFR